MTKEAQAFWEQTAAESAKLAPPAVSPLDLGDKFTIAGYGLSALGHIVINGRSVKTGRKMKVAKLTVLTVTRKLSNSG